MNNGMNINSIANTGPNPRNVRTGAAETEKSSEPVCARRGTHVLQLMSLAWPCTGMEANSVLAVALAIGTILTTRDATGVDRQKVANGGVPAASLKQYLYFFS